MYNKTQNKTNKTQHIRVEARRKFLTLEPFDSKQLLDYLKVGVKLNDIDAKRLIGVINKEFSPDIANVDNLVNFAKNEDKGTIDFAKVSQFIESKKQILVREIANICGSAQLRQQLKELVQKKKDKPFASYQLVDIFGGLEDEATVGCKLLHRNLLFYQHGSDMLTFHAPIVRNAISELPITKCAKPPTTQAN